MGSSTDYICVPYKSDECPRLIVLFPTGRFWSQVITVEGEEWVRNICIYLKERKKRRRGLASTPWESQNLGIHHYFLLINIHHLPPKTTKKRTKNLFHLVSKVDDSKPNLIQQSLAEKGRIAIDYPTTLGIRAADYNFLYRTGSQ